MTNMKHDYAFSYDTTTHDVKCHAVLFKSRVQNKNDDVPETVLSLYVLPKFATIDQKIEEFIIDQETNEHGVISCVAIDRVDVTLKNLSASINIRNYELNIRQNYFPNGINRSAITARYIDKMFNPQSVKFATWDNLSSRIYPNGNKVDTIDDRVVINHTQAEYCVNQFAGLEEYSAHVNCYNGNLNFIIESNIDYVNERIDFVRSVDKINPDMYIEDLAKLQFGFTARKINNSFGRDRTKTSDVLSFRPQSLARRIVPSVIIRLITNLSESNYNHQKLSESYQRFFMDKNGVTLKYIFNSRTVAANAEKELTHITKSLATIGFSVVKDVSSVDINHIDKYWFEIIEAPSYSYFSKKNKNTILNNTMYRLTRDNQSSEYSVFILVDRDIEPVNSIEKIVNRLEYNIRNAIQYNHNISAYETKFGLNILESFLSQVKLFNDYKSFNEFAYNVFNGTNFVKNKNPMPVPKNGEKFTGERMMDFRCDLHNIFMAKGVTDIFSSVIVPPEHLGSRINNGQIVSYIYTYNLFKQEGLELAKQYNNVVYMDFSKFFETIDYSLIHQAVNHFAKDEQSSGINNALMLIKSAMIGNENESDSTITRHNKLTIDSNYEHALSTVVIAYIFEQSKIPGMEYRTFVDDMTVFANNKDTLLAFKDNLLRICDKHGLKLNEEKELWLEGEYHDQLKELVFLPTSLRYRVEDDAIVEIILNVKKNNYRNLLSTLTKPVINAYSDAETFKRNFIYEEAKWVIDSYDSSMEKYIDKLGTLIRPDDNTILEILQFYTVNMRYLGGTDLINLLIIMEEYPSKQKWISAIVTSICDSFSSDIFERIYGNHKTQYMRYLATNARFNFDKFNKKSFTEFVSTHNAAVVENDAQLAKVTSILTNNGYTPAHPDMPVSFNGYYQLLGLEPDTLYVKYDSDSKVYNVIDKETMRRGINEPVCNYPFPLWQWYVENNKSPYNKRIGII